MHRGEAPATQAEPAASTASEPSSQAASASEVGTVPAAGEPQPSTSETVDSVSKEEKLQRY